MNGTTFPPHEFGDSEFSNSGGNNEQRSYQGGQNGYQGGQNSQGGQGGGSWKERNQAGGQQNNQGGQGDGDRSWGSGGGQSGYQKKM